MTGALEQIGWQRSIGGIVPHFSYSSAGNPISASIVKEQGPGWNATIEGQHEVSNGMSNELSILWLLSDIPQLL